MDAKPLLFETGKGLSIKYKDKYLYSKYDPIKNINNLINNLNLENNTIYLIPSPLLGYGLESLKKKLPKHSIILLVETDKELYDISINNEKIHYNSNGLNFIDIINMLPLSNIRKVILLPINGSYNIYKEEYDNLHKIVFNFIHNYWKNRYTLTQMGQLWTKNLLNNSNLINSSRPLSSLKTDKPIVVIGAGESAESIIELLKENRTNIFILCVDTALQILLEVNIKPDAVIALEAQYYNLPDFYGAKNLQLDIIYDLSSYTGVINNLKGNRYYTLTKFSNSSLLYKIKNHYNIKSFIPPLGSVGITAIYIALKLTNNFIFIGGLDFSYTLGKTHSRGTPYHKSTLLNWNKLNPGDSFIQCLKRPILDKKNKMGIVENTDSILFDYSLLTKELLSGNERVLDITSRGMDIGVTKITNLQFTKLLNNNREVDIPLEPIINYDDLLKIEKNKIEKCIDKINKFINKSISLNEVLSSMNEIDYLFDHYPEDNPIEILNETNIKRYLYTLLRFKRVLKK